MRRSKDSLDCSIYWKSQKFTASFSWKEWKNRKKKHRDNKKGWQRNKKRKRMKKTTPCNRYEIISHTFFQVAVVWQAAELTSVSIKRKHLCSLANILTMVINISDLQAN